jgi:hypothetical protein
MLDADGPGQFLGFVYGVRLEDNVDRWSHGGGDNIYIDGEGDDPVYIRGIGGEDSFGVSYGGCIHEPETYHYTSMPFYIYEDIGEARVVQRLVGYRFFEHDELPFQKSIHMRFGSMRNDICSTVYWYQEGAVRPFFNIPTQYEKLIPGSDLPKGSGDIKLPDTGSWWLCGPFDNVNGQAMAKELLPEMKFDSEAAYDGLHEVPMEKGGFPWEPEVARLDSSRWLTEGSKELGLDVARWIKRKAFHNFIDFRHVFRPHHRGVSPTQPGAALARCILESPKETEASLLISWDDQLILRVNSEDPRDLGDHSSFRSKKVKVSLREGENTIIVKLSNTIGSNFGGWCFAMRATTSEGSLLLPKA